MNDITRKTQLAEELERDLLDFYKAPILGGEQLQRALGFASMQAMRKAAARGVLPVAVFKIENRRGYFALVKDVAHWLAFQRVEKGEKKEAGGDT